MKTIHTFYSLITCLTIVLLLMAFTSKPVKVIVDEIVFANESASTLALAAAAPITLPVAALKNLPTTFDQKDTTGSIKWYANNSKAAGYFVRIERVGSFPPRQIKLDFLMLLTSANQGHVKVVLFLPPIGSQATTKLIQNIHKPTDLNVFLESKGGLTCELFCEEQGFKIRNIRLPGQENAQFQVTVFSKNDIK